ncbi:M48 family metallopeptidase [Pseudidiomarina sediminum]|nr:SprT family zinc-dependent metalloprotease [Pseudidiomarina sediminum]
MIAQINLVCNVSAPDNETKKAMSAIYPIQRSKRRRTVAIKISQGEVIVQAPLHLSETRIRSFVQRKQAWIDKHLQQQQQHLAKLSPRYWQAGERLRWLGEPLTLEVQQASRKSCKREGQQLLATRTPRANPEREPRGVIIAWYKQQAQAWLDAFFAQWCRRETLQPQGWQVKSFSSKWGHCTRKGELSFSWKLWLAPEWVVRNVVIHELCHLQEFNHSAAFWALVAQHSSDYQAAEKWLRQHGMTVLNETYLDYHEDDLTATCR